MKFEKNQKSDDDESYNDVLSDGKVLNYFVTKVEFNDIQVNRHVKEYFAHKIRHQLSRFVAVEYLNYKDEFDAVLPTVVYKKSAVAIPAPAAEPAEPAPAVEEKVGEGQKLETEDAGEEENEEVKAADNESDVVGEKGNDKDEPVDEAKEEEASNE